MKAMIKKIAIGAAAAAMAMSAVAVTASAAVKHPGESGCCYDANENTTNAYGKHPGESGYCYDADKNTTNAYGKHPGESGYCYDADKNTTNAYGKHPGESGYCYDANELGYDPSKYTEEQIRMIEASREVNGFVCGTLLIQFDEENAAKAKTEEKPQHATGLKVIGDVNCDGVVDVSDSVLFCRVLNEDASAVMTAQGRINADVNGDGKLTIDDNTALLDRIAKKE